MKTTVFLSIYLVSALLLMGLPLFGNLEVSNPASAAPDDGIDGYQELFEDWTVTGYEEYTNEYIVLWGDLTVENGGHLVLKNCTLTMMYQYLQPYTIKVEGGGIMEVYDCYVTDIPDDDDLDLLSAWYYFFARAGSTLIIENTTIRQVGFLDPSNMEHMGLSVGTNQGHIKNSIINSSLVALAFVGNNTGFSVENMNISDIGMSAIMITNSEGGSVRNVSFQNIQERDVINVQNSWGFKLEDFNLSGDFQIRVYSSYGFTFGNITGYGNERLVEIEDSNDFILKNITIVDQYNWNQLIDLRRCFDFHLDQVSALNANSIISLKESYDGLITDISGSNITRIIDFNDVSSIEIDGVSVDSSSDAFWIWDSDNLSIKNVIFTDAWRPIWFEGVNDSVLDDITINEFTENAVTLRGSSSNITISNADIRTDSMEFTTGIRIEESSVNLNDINMHNNNHSISLYNGDIYGENIFINGTYLGDEGIGLERAKQVYLSNVSIQDQRFRGIWLRNSFDSDIRMENIYIDDINDAVLIQDANATLSNLVVTNAVYDILAAGFIGRCFVTVMNSTLDRPYIDNSDMVFINTTNASTANTGGVWSLTWKWWVDVYVHDSQGPVAGAEARIVDSFFIIELTAYTGIDGFARYLPVTDMIWTSIIPLSRNPHTSSALGPGWGSSNSTPYWVTQNMQVNVYYPWNAPPNEPTNLVAQSDENSDVVLTWDPSTSQDVGNYTIYIARSEPELLTYMGLGIPNATVQLPTFTHVSGADDWHKFWYGVKAKDNENESVFNAKAYCGDWVVNATSPQYVQDENISVEGTLWVYGILELTDTRLRIHSSNRYPHGIYAFNASIYKCENATIERNTTYPYFFIIEAGANVSINGSDIIRPGYDNQNYEEYFKGIYSSTDKLSITNTTVEVIYRGLGIYGISSFQGQIYNTSFIVPSGSEADALLTISSSNYVKVVNCYFEGWVQYGIYGIDSQEIQVTNTNITTSGDWGVTFYGIYLQECMNSEINDNPTIRANPGVYLIGTTNITIETSFISSRKDVAIYGLFSHETTIRNCYLETEEGDQKGGIYLSWCSDSTIEDFNLTDVNPFLILDNGTGAIISNITIINGEKGIQLVNSNDVYVYDTYLSFMMNGMIVTGCRDVYLINLTVNLTFYCMDIRSPGPIYFINSYIANGIANEIIAEGWGGEHGEITMINSTIVSISDNSLKLNNSAVVSLINTSFNFTKLTIDDAGSRVEVYHYLSVQVYDIDMNIPAWANITIFNSLDFTVHNGQAPNGLAEWILIHERTVFRDDEYSDNPHNIVFDDGKHFGNVELFINYTQHVDVNVTNNPPWIQWLEIHGRKGMQVSLAPTTDYNIVLNYGYQDPEGDPESGTIIRWFVNGWLNGSFNEWTSIPSLYTRKGQYWHAVVYPSDGYDSTYPMGPYVTNILPIENTPPVVSNVTISPVNPTGGDDLYVDYDHFDLDEDDLAMSKTTQRWYFFNNVSGLWEYSSIDSFYLSSQYTSKGQFWYCNVTPNDGDDSGNTVSSNIVQIGNTPPSASNAKITAESGDLMITGADNLKATYNYTDSDGDTENDTSYQWYLKRGVDPWTPYAVNASILPFNYTIQGDLWRCRIVPMDGEDFGAMVWTDVVEIFNTPPVVSNVTITPASPTSSEALSITYDFYDYDGDFDNGTSFRWVYEDALGAKDPGEYGDGVPASEIQKGQTWYCYVKPSDGKNVGTEVISAGVLVLNSPPFVISGGIDIVNEDTGRLLTLNYTVSDVDADTISNVEIQWFADGDAQTLFDNNETVSGENLVKGQQWYASMRIYDGEAWSVWYDTLDIVIPNTAPYLNGTPVLTPKALSSENLVPTFQSLYQDVDGDPLVSWDAKWYKDNGHMEKYDGYEDISWDITKKGEIWFCKIQVSDGEDTSEWYSSTTSVIENTPPSNVSVNPQQSEVVMIETDTMEFSVSAEDTDDDDQLSYRWMLDGRIVLLEEGVGTSIYLLKTDFDSEGEYILRLVITDGDDLYENTWTIDIQKMNRLPEITVVGPEGRSATIDEDQSLAFSITKSDPDSDALDVRWLLDGVQVWEASDKYTYTPSFTASGSHGVTVEVYEKDTGANSTYTWSVEVENVESPEDKKETLLGQSYDWWGLVLAILSGIIALLLATIGLMRVRKKKSRLKEYMQVTDKLMEEEDPTTIEDKLLDVEAQIKDEFSQGKIEDLHFLLLQDIIAGKRSEIRKAAVTRKFGRLPEGVLRDLDAMLKDGKISRAEYGTFVSTISKSESLSSEEKEELSDMIGKWEEEDKVTIPAELKEDIGFEEHLEDDAEEPGEKESSQDTSSDDEGGEEEPENKQDEENENDS
jgi:hypothetical protein